MPRSRTFVVRAVVHFSLALLFLCAATTASAERAPAPELFPENTLVYFRVSSAPELVEKFQQTALGRLGADKQIRPLIAQLYGSAAQAFTEVEERVGSSLDELLKLPQGEIAVGVVAGEGSPPNLAVLVDVGDQDEMVARLFDRLRAEVSQTKTETIDDVEVLIASRPNRPNRPVVVFKKDETVVVTSNLELSRTLLERWGGGHEKSLATNKKFGAIMSRCVAKKEEPPQVTWFVDPIELARGILQGNFAAQAGLALLPALGLDGLSGVGGSVTLATESFDMVSHTHLLLENPRTGVLDMVALESGDMTPENWIPADVSSYFTLHWDLSKTYEGGGALFDSFRGEGSFAALVKRRFSDQLDIDFEKEMLPALDGRISHAMWYERPIRPGAETRALAFKLKDPDAFSAALMKAVNKFNERLTGKDYGGYRYYQFTPRGQQAAAADAGAAPAGADQPLPDDPRAARRAARQRQQPCVTILGDYLVFTNRPTAMEKVITTHNDSSQSLATQLDYKVTATKLRRLQRDREAAMITFDRPEEQMRALYDLLTADSTREWLSVRVDRNRGFKALNDSLTDHPLPPFSVISKYLAPGGGILTNEETGIHYIGFALRRGSDDE
jgi:hypothetical protein